MLFDSIIATVELLSKLESIVAKLATALSTKSINILNSLLSFQPPLVTGEKKRKKEKKERKIKFLKSSIGRDIQMRAKFVGSPKF